ncbi:phage repressor [Burkholderia ubonensis]|uniref:LexA family protein n=1 Tax=Burkholderia ubonensis TaxID=101571 RepID=UPI000757A47B|nr:helix-turn-helix domain-containing protein [Burkholderia ubonensis]KVD16599.1 phage repressor [Burkholderia ubonensis]KVU11939.1 phage repressor [Burkholderia ubonensis]KWE66433.1 phage repressor [Burkholderia ubonensis]
METTQRLALMVTRIRALMQRQGLSDADLARKTGVSPATLSRVLSMATEDPRISTVMAIADALGTTVGYLLQSERAYPIPILGWDEMLGYARGVYDVARNTRWLTVDTPRRPGTFAARTKPSMAPRFREGSIVIVEPGVAFRDAQVVVAAIDGGEPTLRRVTQDGEAVWLKGLAPSPADTINAFDASVVVLGVVTESRLVNP